MKSALDFNASYRYPAMELLLTGTWGLWGKFFIGSMAWLGIGTIMLMVTSLRFAQVMKSKHKVKRLNKDNYFSVSPQFLKQNLNKKPDSIYVGKGFIWENKHIQIYHNILALPERKKFIDQELTAGGYDFLHNLGSEEEKDIIIPRDELQHTIAAGTTRVGKTRFLELLAYQMIAAGETLIIVDPKGDSDLLNCIYDACVDCEREDDFYYFSLAHTSASCKFNPLLNYGGASDIADRISSIIPGGGDSEPFTKFAWQVIETIAAVCISLDEPITLERLQYYSLGGMTDLLVKAQGKIKTLTGDKRRYAESCLQKLEIQAQHPKDHYQKMITSLGPVLSALNSGDTSELVNADLNDSERWQDIIGNKKVIYFYLASMLKGEVANNIGKLIVQDLLYYMGELYAFDTPQHGTNLMVDEFYSVMFPGYVDLLNKAGGAGLRVLLAMQTTSDIVSATEKIYMAKQILGNVNNKFYLRVPEKELAEEFCGLFGQSTIRRKIKTRNVAADAKSQAQLFRSGYSEQVQEDVVDLISPEMVMHLPKGQAFAFSQGRDPYKIRIPLLNRVELPRMGFAEALRDVKIKIRSDNGMYPKWICYNSAEEAWERRKLAS